MVNRIRKTIRAAAAALAAALAAGAMPQALAQDYPSRPVKILVGFAPGGAMDIVARTVAQKMAPGLGQPVVVENKPGAASNIAIRQLIESPSDGYTIMLVANGLTANPLLYTQQPFDPNSDVAPITLVARLPVVIAAGTNSQLTSLAKLIDISKERPGSVNYGSPGSGSTPHLATEMFARAAGIKLTHIPYKGGSPAITDVLGGQLAESGFKGFEASVWHAFIAPKGTPPAIVDRFVTEIHKALGDPQVKERLAGLGAVVSPSSPQELATLVRTEHERYGKLIREGNIKAN